MDYKLIGCILLIVGTSIGAGMLALPIATAQLGFIGSLILLFSCWFVMTASAFLILEVNLWLPKNSNMVSMARATIGPFGQILAWISYLLLLYSLLCAYIAGGSDLLRNLLVSVHVDLPAWATTIVFTALLGTIVYVGIHCVDYVNRGLMTVKLLAYLLLVLLLTRYISLDHLLDGDIKQMTSIAAITVTITSFGFASIVPSLRVYFAGNVRKLKMAVLAGSLIPLVCYILWDMAIMGVIPLNGEHGLISILQSKSSTSDLVNVLTATASVTTVSMSAKLFTSICVVTSFLGVGLCLTDFLADGLQMEKKGGNNLIIHLLTFLPPITVVLFFPDVFVKALEYAGIYCIILLILLPAWMAWRGRYTKKMAQGYQVVGGKPLLLVLLVFSVVTIAYGLLDRFLG